MPVLLVLCDAEDAPRLEAAFAEYEESLRLSASSYLLHCSTQHNEVLGNLKSLPELARPDSLFVITLQQPHVPISGDVNRWLQRVVEKDGARHKDAPGPKMK